MKFKVTYRDENVDCTIELEGQTIPRVGDVIDLQNDRNFYEVQSVVLKYDQNYSEDGFEIFAKKRPKEPKSNFVFDFI